MKFKISFLLICLVFYTSSLKSQSKEPSNIFEVEKWSLGLGVGIPYGLFGFQGKYFFSKFVGVSAGLGGIVPYFPQWSANLELRHPNLITNRISPYLMVSYGHNCGVNFFDVRTEERTVKSFKGISLGTGLKFNIIQQINSYVTLGLSYRIIPKEVDDFVNDYNEQNNTNYSSEIGSLIPVLGWTYCF